jgi:hypothetical protein
MATIACLKFGWLSKLAENIFSAVKTDNPLSYWKVSEEDENLVWFFEKADGNCKHDASVLFYYGSDYDADALISFPKTLSPMNTLRGTN